MLNVTEITACDEPGGSVTGVPRETPLSKNCTVPEGMMDPVRFTKALRWSVCVATKLLIGLNVTLGLPLVMVTTREPGALALKLISPP